MLDVFRNEPPIDFSRRENRERFNRTLEKVRSEFSRERRRAGEYLESLNPADPREIVGRVRVAGNDRITAAIARAERFSPKWRATPAPIGPSP